jgi:hypothetical protein
MMHAAYRRLPSGVLHTAQHTLRPHVSTPQL